MTAYYNEHDPYCAAWLRNLIGEGLIAPGDVDERSIKDVRPDDVRGYVQVHLFAGVGGWSHALRLAGWRDEWRVWTGSCPCQPFSSAGKRQGSKDARHLWPYMRHLIFQCHPPVAFGEQVASKAGREWLVGVRANLEVLGYAVGSADLCAAGVGAANIRQRLFWVAYRYGARCEGQPGRGVLRQEQGERARPIGACACGEDGGLAQSNGHRPPAGRLPVRPGQAQRAEAEPDGAGSSSGCRLGSPASLVHCTDGKQRRVEPGTFPLAHGLPRSVGPGGTRQQRMELVAAKANRVGRLKGYGNAIHPEVAAEFIRAWMELTP